MARLFKIGLGLALLWLALNAFTLTRLFSEAESVGAGDWFLRAKITALQLSPYAALLVGALIYRSVARRRAERIAELQAAQQADRDGRRGSMRPNRFHQQRSLERDLVDASDAGMRAIHGSGDQNDTSSAPEANNASAQERLARVLRN